MAEEDFAEQLAALDMGIFLASAGSTVAGLVGAKLQRRDLAQAKLGIDALAALVPLLEGDLKRELEATLASLQVSYADAASTP